jgi:hypothetical protein
MGPLLRASAAGRKASKSAAARGGGAQRRMLRGLADGSLAAHEVEEAGLLPDRGAVADLRAAIAGLIGEAAEADAFTAANGKLADGTRYAAVVAAALTRVVLPSPAREAAVATAVQSYVLGYEDTVRAAALAAAGIRPDASECFPCPRCHAPDTGLEGIWGRADNPVISIRACGTCGWRER